MKKINGKNKFGFWQNQPYKAVTDEYDDFIKFKNTIDKNAVIEHIESLGAWLGSTQSHDIFTGEEFNSGFYVDGDFQFPVDFLRYYKTKDIGIPYEYEEYLKGILK
jgi:hypothetical protein